MRLEKDFLAESMKLEKSEFMVAAIKLKRLNMLEERSKVARFNDYLDV